MIEHRDFSEAAIAHRLSKLLLAILACSFIVGFALSYWSVVRSDVLAVRPDNPRTVEAELRVQRGSIVDRNNVVLAENTGPLDQQARIYPLKEAGPAVGHYSMRYGVSGIEAAYDSMLRGTDIGPIESEINGLMHVPPSGRDIRLTLDATLQQTAAQLMMGQQGALILLELTESAEQPTAEVRAMVSQPWYDPNDLDSLLNNLDEGAEASFFNRVTQGQYQPGLLLLPLLAPAAFDSGTVDPAGALPERAADEGSGDSADICPGSAPESEVTWLEAIRNRCSRAAAELGQLMSAAELSEVFHALGLTSTPSIPIQTVEATVTPIVDVERAALGQDTLTVSPLQIALAYGALASGGELPLAQLVDAVESASGRWEQSEPLVRNGSAVQAFTSASASLVRRAFPLADETAGITVPVVSAADGQPNQWYVGFAPNDQPIYVAVVVLEKPEDVGLAEDIGQQILSQAMLQP